MFARRARCSTRTSSFAPLAAALAVVGFGLGLALVAVTAAVLAVVPAGALGHGRLDA